MYKYGKNNFILLCDKFLKSNNYLHGVIFTCKEVIKCKHNIFTLKNIGLVGPKKQDLVDGV